MKVLATDFEIEFQPDEQLNYSSAMRIDDIDLYQQSRISIHKFGKKFEFMYQLSDLLRSIQTATSVLKISNSFQSNQPTLFMNDPIAFDFEVKSFGSLRLFEINNKSLVELQISPTELLALENKIIQIFQSYWISMGGKEKDLVF